MNESLERLDDMRLVAELLSGENFTRIAGRLSMPKQTLSRRVAAVEASLGVRLVDRTTRTFRVTSLGRAYAERCAEVVRMAEDVNRAVRGEAMEVSGTLRVTADPLFGERFLPPIVAAFARKHRQVKVDVVLTSRAVDLIEEGFDIAFRIGAAAPPSMVAIRVADALLVYVVSKKYAEKRGVPKSPEDLASHDCIALVPEGGTPRWAFRDGERLAWLPVQPRIRVNHLGLAKEAALEGLGVANVPYFACRDDIAGGRLRLVLRESTVPFGSIFVVHPPRRLVTPRVRAFRDLALAELRARPELTVSPLALERKTKRRAHEAKKNGPATR